MERTGQRMGTGAVVAGQRISLFLKYGKEPAVERVHVSDRQVEEIASLKGVRLAGLLAGLDFSVMPDGAPVISWDIGTQEVYSLNWHIQ